MIRQRTKPPSSPLHEPINTISSEAKPATTLRNVSECSQERDDDFKGSKKSSNDIISPCPSSFGSSVSRRHLMGASGDSPPNDPMDVLKRTRPPRPGWYEGLYAWMMATTTKAYEAEIAGYKSQVFANLRGKANTILEFGIGTGPNLKYYANEPGVQVIGVDPNLKMEKYARAAAEGAGLPPESFQFKQAVGEALPLDDASVDAVVGTLVLCSVKNVDLSLQEIMRVLKPGGLFVFVEHVAAEDGTIRRFFQGVLDPLQQFVADRCHLTRQTGNIIAKAGFSKVDLQQVFLSTATIANPQVYGIAQK